MTRKILIGTWGKPHNLKGYPLGHPRNTLVSIQRHRDMLYNLYLPYEIKFIIFDPYFIALDRIPTFNALEELSLFKKELLKFNEELNRLSIVRYGHNSHYCHFLSQNPKSRSRSIHEIEYLLELAEIINLLGVGIHLSGNSKSSSTVKQAIEVLSRFDEKKLKKIYLENMPTKEGCLSNVLSIAKELPINIAFDVGHFISSPYEKMELYSAISEIVKITNPKALFIHLSKDIKRVHINLNIPWCISFIQNMNRLFDLDLHIDIESPDRINDTLKLKKHFENLA